MDKDIKKLLEENKKILIENQITKLKIDNPLNGVIAIQESTEILVGADSRLKM